MLCHRSNSKIINPYIINRSTRDFGLKDKSQNQEVNGHSETRLLNYRSTELK